jgi:hypothetical protein
LYPSLNRFIAYLDNTPVYRPSNIAPKPTGTDAR